MDEDNNPMEEERRRVEHERVIRQRRQVPETEEDLLAMQEEFFKAQDRPAASVVRVQRLPPVVQSGPSINKSKSTTVQDDDDDDMPPPLEKDVVALDGDDLPARPPTITPSGGVLRGGSRFLQNRADKGPRTHFQTVGERFEINLDDEEEQSPDPLEDEIPAETENETMRRLASAGPSMGHILNEVLEKPVGEAIAPAGATTSLGSLEPAMRPSKAAAKGKSLFARRLAEAQGTAAPKSSSSADRPASSSYVKLTQGNDFVQKTAGMLLCLRTNAYMIANQTH